MGKSKATFQPQLRHHVQVLYITRPRGLGLVSGFRGSPTQTLHVLCGVRPRPLPLSTSQPTDSNRGYSMKTVRVNVAHPSGPVSFHPLLAVLGL